MACILISGTRAWSLSRDSDGHRTYKVKHRVRADVTDGPYNVLNTPGLPAVGSPWNFDADDDQWATCRPEATVQTFDDIERIWTIEQTYSTKPIDRCSTTSVEDPLMEPPQISWSFVSYTEEASEDRFGKRITNSAHELIRGPVNEWSGHYLSVKITQNVALLNMAWLSAYIDTVNSEPIWGYDARDVKITNISADKKYRGQCEAYFTRTIEFECRPGRTEYMGPGTANEVTVGGHDRVVMDEGTKALHGKWNSDGQWELIQINGADPDPTNPTHFDRVTDKQGNPIKVILNGHGVPWNPDDEQPDVSAHWCIHDPVNFYCYEGTCNGARAEAASLGVMFSGPNFDPAGCTESCTEETAGSPCLSCPGDGAGKILIEKYPEADFLGLGIPLDLET